MSLSRPHRPPNEKQANQAPPASVCGKRADVVVAIGGSAGSPRIIEQICLSLPADLPAAVMVSLHMPPGFTFSFAGRLDQASPIKVKEAAAEDSLIQGLVLIAPGDYHLIAVRSAVALSSAPKVHHVRPAIDVMLESLARTDHEVIAVILSGMGRDGSAGAQLLKRHKPHSIVIVQDPRSSVIASMPGAVINSGCFDEMLLPSRIAGRIVAHVQNLIKKYHARGE